MTYRRGTIRCFDAADGLGDITLEDGTDVRFGTSALKDFRSVAPAPGVHVLVGEIKPGFRGALRASEVLLAEESWDETWNVVGIASPRVIETEIPKKRVRLLPFDEAVFPKLASALAKDDIDRRSFSKPRPLHATRVHPVMQPLVPIVSPHTRSALGFSRAAGEPAVGSTFVGGAYADLGPGDWPAPEGTPLAHVLQISRSDAEALGFDQQINLFVGAFSASSLRTPMLDALGMAPLFGAVPRSDSPFLVVSTRGGSRRKSPTGGTQAIALGDAVMRTVCPPLNTFRSDDETVQREVDAFILRAYVVDPNGHAFEPDLCLRSVQAYYRAAFPSADDMDDDLVLGGIAPHLPGEESPRKRLASLKLGTFPEVRPLVAQGDRWLGGNDTFHWERWALDSSADASPQSWAYGR